MNHAFGCDKQCAPWFQITGGLLQCHTLLCSILHCGNRCLDQMGTAETSLCSLVDDDDDDDDDDDAEIAHIL
eukprot:4216745-Amphidinium_carterae.2